jgi:hypothetical protein
MTPYFWRAAHTTLAAGDVSCAVQLNEAVRRARRPIHGRLGWPPSERAEAGARREGEGWRVWAQIQKGKASARAPGSAGWGIALCGAAAAPSPLSRSGRPAAAAHGR